MLIIQRMPPAVRFQINLCQDSRTTIHQIKMTPSSATQEQATSFHVVLKTKTAEELPRTQSFTQPFNAKEPAETFAEALADRLAHLCVKCQDDHLLNAEAAWDSAQELIGEEDRAN